MRFNYTHIPDELKKCNNWVCWGKDKIPKNPNTGVNASTDDPSTWSDFHTAINAVDKRRLQGIGFMITQPYFGLDLTNCLQDMDFMNEFIDTLGTYSEYSMSQQGVHIICKGELPRGVLKRGSIEIYPPGTFFACTGQQCRESIQVQDCTQSIKMLQTKYMLNPLATKKNDDAVETDRIVMTDQQVIEKAKLSKMGYLFELLYQGNWLGLYEKQSNADLALCNILAFWCQKDKNQIDNIFRSSRLYRTIWDETTKNNITYGEKTIEKAIAGCKEIYTYDMQGKEHEIEVSGRLNQEKKPEVKDYELSDSGNAQRFDEQFENRVKFNHTDQSWYYWNGKLWERDTREHIKILADECVRKIKEDAFAYDDDAKQEMLLKWGTKTANSRPKSNMLLEARHLKAITANSEDFNKRTDLLNCGNGIVNLRTGKLMDHSPAAMMSRISFSDFADDVPKPKLWMKFLDDITNSDKELQTFLQKAVGYSLSGSVIEQAMFICYGNGCNGKSTFLDIVMDLAGTYGMSMQSESIMMKPSNNSANSDIARLQGSRFVNVAEPGEQMRLNESLIKQMTGGERLTARFLHCNEFEFYPEFKVWIGTNHKPIIRGNDDGIWRRVRLIPFITQIPKENIDRQLHYKLRKELPSIMRWAVEGCLLWQKDGLSSPPCVAIASEEYRSEMDVLSKFVDDCIEISYNDNIKAINVYQIYEQWANANNEYCFTNTAFGKKFSQRFPEKVKKRDGWYYKDCKFSTYANENFTISSIYGDRKSTSGWKLIENPNKW